MNFHNEKDFQEQHDFFVRHYNKAKNKLSAITELRTIQQAVEEYVTLKTVEFSQKFTYMLNRLRVDEKMSWLPEEKKEEIRSQFVPYLYFESTKVLDAVEWLEITKEAYEVYYNTVQGAEGATEDMKVIAKNLQGVYRAMLKAVQIESIVGSAIRKDFPPKLSRFKDLSDEEQQKLTARVGAPLNQDVPQGKVESIVDNLFRDQESGRVIVEVDGEKHAYQIIHQNGRWKGKANVNQIYKYFVTVHPDLDGLTDRQLKERIKKALPDDMK